ncbi:CYTH and CHAD domain-containing protein [Arthrobacter sp. USHLN218]|uniref:CYTH and CHAD domain-containing protein n=1 Tax=Arthrobacter sp. USHLN218 TaxID=3081232 RepID=UPI003016F9A6
MTTADTDAVQETVEVERKYDVDESPSLPPLQDLPGVQSVDQPVEHQLEATYFDTEDLTLAAHRITLRRRTGGDDEGWHLKLPAGTDARRELHEPLGKDREKVPLPLLRLVRSHVRDRPLAGIARLRTRRVVHRLRGADGVLAEVADDHVEAAALPRAGRSEGPASEPVSRWREWEIELADGRRDLLDAAEELFRAAGAEPSAHASKLARALGQQLPQAEPGPPPQQDATAADVVLAYLQAQATALKEQDPLVRQDAPDAIHQMRVATRRLRSSLATHRRLFDPDRTAALREELKQLAGLLGEARDAEVMHERLRTMIGEEPPDLVLGPVAQRIDVDLATAYKSAHDKVLKALEQKRYFRLLDSLDEFLADPPLAGEAQGPATKVIAKSVRRDLKRVRRAVKEAKRTRGTDAADPALHEARKTAKRLRYACEAAAPVGGKRALKLEDSAHGIQQVLGDHQDSFVARQLLRKAGVEAFGQHENGFSYGRLHALEEARAARSEKKFWRRWKDFPAKSW